MCCMSFYTVCQMAVQCKLCFCWPSVPSLCMFPDLAALFLLMVSLCIRIHERVSLCETGHFEFCMWQTGVGSPLLLLEAAHRQVMEKWAIVTARWGGGLKVQQQATIPTKTE